MLEIRLRNDIPRLSHRKYVFINQIISGAPYGIAGGGGGYGGGYGIQGGGSMGCGMGGPLPQQIPMQYPSMPPMGPQQMPCQGADSDFVYLFSRLRLTLSIEY